MIPIRIIAELIQQKLGIDFIVNVDSFPDALDNRIPAVVYAERVPFATDKDTEAIRLNLELYAPATVQGDKNVVNDKVAEMFNAINGVKYQVTDNDITYQLSVYFESARPQFIDVDTGEQKILYTINGTALATSSDVAFAKDIEISIDGDPLKVLSFSFTKNEEYKTVTNLTSRIEQKPRPNSRARMYVVDFLSDNSQASKDIESEIIEGGDVAYDTYSLSIKKSNGTTVTRTVRLISATFSGAYGGYATIAASFMAV